MPTAAPYIHPDAIRKDFQPFFTTKDDAGNGLGLSLSKRFVEENGGKMSVRSSSRPVRNGSAFKIRLAHR